MSLITKRWPVAVLAAMTLALGCTGNPAGTGDGEGTTGGGKTGTSTKTPKPKATKTPADDASGTPEPSATPTGDGTTSPSASPTGSANPSASPSASTSPASSSSPSASPSATTSPTATTTPTPTPSPRADGGTVFAGSTYGKADGTGAAAQFRTPSGLAADAAGNVYVADAESHAIRKVTAAGAVTTVAGTGVTGFTNGAVATALFKNPAGLAVTADGTIYVADTGNHAIRKIKDGQVTTIAGTGVAGKTNGAGASAMFNGPEGLAVAADGTIYVADTGNKRIRKITAAGEVSDLAGSDTEGSANGTGTAATFKTLRGIAIDGSGDLWICQANMVRKCTPAGVVTTIAGLADASGSTDGTGDAARFSSNVVGIAPDGTGNFLVCDLFTSKLRKVTPAGVVTTVKSGSDYLGVAVANGKIYASQMAQAFLLSYPTP